jgi:hypothetical protein
MDDTFQNVVSEINSIPSQYLNPESPDSSNVILKMKKSQVAKTSSYWKVSIFGIAAVLAFLYLIQKRKKSGV